jgi:DNA polymerase-3 subunit gamma/tau
MYMSTETLYRKYRPTQFSEVLGQKTITRTLTNQIKSRKLGHAYLFTGIRGTGKTTIGRIFARTINCSEKGIEPCGVCEACKDSKFNIIEMDAASHNGVDDIRQLNDEVKYPPARGEYKIYIIDEVHMLSTGAFNALLKTLEEPPEHVIFILATTDPQKIPATILSRVQRFNVKRLSEADLNSLIVDVATKEQMTISDDGVEYIGSLGDGSARDTLSILEQVSTSYFSEEIDAMKVRELIGAVDKFVYLHLTKAVIDDNFPKCAKIISSVINEGRNIRVVVSEYIKYLRGLLMLINNVQVVDDTKIYDGVQGINKGELISLLREMSELEGQLKSNPSPILLEIKFAIACNPISNSSNSENEIKELKKEIEMLKEQVKQMGNNNASRNAASSIHDNLDKYWDSICKNISWQHIMERVELLRNEEVYQIIIPHYLMSYEGWLLKKLEPYINQGLVFEIINK